MGTGTNHSCLLLQQVVFNAPAIPFKYLKRLQESWRGTLDKGVEWPDKGEWLLTDKGYG